MQQYQIYVGQSIRGAKQFFDVNGIVVATVRESDAMHQLEASIAVLDATGTEQGTRTRETRGEVQRRLQLEQLLVRKFVTPLSKFARAQLVGEADYAALTPSAGKLHGERLVQTARSMVAAAAPYAEKLTAAKFPQDFLAQFGKATDAVRESIDTKKEKKMLQAGATKQIATALRNGRAAIATLDSLVSHVILGNERLEREWRAAKRITRSSGRGAAAAIANATGTPVVSQEVKKEAA